MKKIVTCIHIMKAVIYMYPLSKTLYWSKLIEHISSFTEKSYVCVFWFIFNSEIYVKYGVYQNVIYTEINIIFKLNKYKKKQPSPIIKNYKIKNWFGCVFQRSTKFDNKGNTSSTFILNVQFSVILKTYSF